MAGDEKSEICKTFQTFSLHLLIPLLTTLHLIVSSLSGDIHGDLEKCKQSFLAGIIDDAGNWCGGSSTVVQVGDILDRGSDEIKTLYFLERLKLQALNSGGKIITMNGNHEMMNMDDLPGDPFCGIPVEFKGVRKEFHDGFRNRIAALRPNGPLSTRFFANNATVLVMGENVFVHGGLLVSHVNYGLERINKEVKDWINGVRKDLWRDISRGRDSVVWVRKFSHELAESCDCEALEHVLATIPGAKRMIMGHTIQMEGINGACEGKAIRIDVGMSRRCGNGLPEVLEIAKDSEVRILTANPAYCDSYGARELKSGKRDGLGVLLEDRPKQIQARA